MIFYKPLLLVSPIIFILGCSTGLDNNQQENVLDYFLINDGHAAIDNHDNFILYPLHPDYFQSRDFNAAIVFPPGYQLYLEDSLIQNKDHFIFRNAAINDCYKVRLIKESHSLEYTLIFSTVPVVQIFAGGTLSDSQLPASLLITSAFPDEDLRNTLIGLEYRGRFSLRFPKKSFRFETRDKDNFADKDDETILSIRNDDDWILDGSADDPLILRNRVAMDLFEEFWDLPHANDAHVVNHGRFVELFINSRYHGIYNLAERVDRKLLQLSQPNSLLFKARRPHDLSYLYNDVKALYEISYPAEDDLHEHKQAWQRLKDLTEFIINSDDDVFLDQFDEKVNIGNILNYHIFLLVVSATDNYLHNFYLAQNDNDPFFFIPWDLDDSFECLGCFNGNFLTNRLIKQSSYTSLIKERWQYLRANQGDAQTIFLMFKDYYDLLLHSNAYQRNARRWSTDDAHLDDFEQLQDWIEQRNMRVDAYINNL